MARAKKGAARAKTKTKARELGLGLGDIAMAPDMDEVRVPSARYGVPMMYIGAALVVLAAIIVAALFFAGVFDKSDETGGGSGSGPSTTTPPGPAPGGSEPGANARQQFTYNRLAPPAQTRAFFDGLATINPQTKRVRITASGSPTLGDPQMSGGPIVYQMMSPSGESGSDEGEGKSPTLELFFDPNNNGYTLKVTHRVSSSATIAPPPAVASLSIDVEGTDERITVTTREFPGNIVTYNMSMADFVGNLRSTTDIKTPLVEGAPALQRIVVETNPANFYDAATSQKGIGGSQKDGLSAGAIVGIVFGAISLIALIVIAFIFREKLMSSGKAAADRVWDWEEGATEMGSRVTRNVEEDYGEAAKSFSGPQGRYTGEGDPSTGRTETF